MSKFLQPEVSPYNNKTLDAAPMPALIGIQEFVKRLSRRARCRW